MLNFNTRKRVAVVVDAASHYGRAVARGAMQYANQHRRWAIDADFRQTDSLLQETPECDGAIVAGVSLTRFEALLRSIPFIVSCSSGTEPGTVPVVAVDSAACGRAAAEHLIECRLKHFAFCGWSDVVSAQHRLDGFRRALQMRALSCDVIAPASELPGESMAKRFRPELVAWLRALPKPVGIFAHDDWVAYDLAAVCQAEGILVPQQVAIVGVNNDDLLCPTAWPPLSSVEVDFHQIGYLAARQLDRLLHGETLRSEDRALRLLPSGVVPRQSTDLVAVRDRHVAAAVKFIRKHACDPCSVDDVLKHVPVGRRWLERKFVEMLDRTLFDELQQVRLETAQRLLLETDEKIEKVAETCGFNTARSFIRAFNRALGTTPAAYRRAHHVEPLPHEP